MNERAAALDPVGSPTARNRLRRVLAGLPGTGDDARAVLNGLFGDSLAEQGSRLAIPMSIRTSNGDEVTIEREAIAHAFPEAGHRVCVFVHGLMSNESIWQFPREHERTYGSGLAEHHGVTSVYLRYNSGCHISTNGRELAALLQQLVGAWPVRVREIDLVGHSMGGLVVRSACHAGRRRATWLDRLRGRGPWTARVRRIVLLGVPNGGARMEVVANLTSTRLRSVPTPVTRLLGAGLDRRSDGIKDLRWGAVLDNDWIGRDPAATDPITHVPVVVPRRADVLAIAGALLENRVDTVHPINRVLGDALVTTPSAHGLVGDDRSAMFPRSTTHVLPRINHIALAHRDEVEHEILTWWPTARRR